MQKPFSVLWPILGALLLLVVGYFLLMPAEDVAAATQATTWEVDRQDDPALPNAGATACTVADNDCSLRGAIDQAADGDTIEIIETGTIALNSAIALDKDLKIIGGSPNTFVIDGGGGARIFEIGADRKVTLQFLTLQNGDSSGDSGGAVIMSSGALTLAGVFLQDNTAGDKGGALAIDVNGGTADVMIAESLFRRNHAQDDFESGGAIYAHADDFSTINLFIFGARFNNNIGGVVDGDATDGDGGAITAATLDQNSRINVDIRTVEFINNRSGSGGAIYLDSYNRSNSGTSLVTGSIRDSQFTANQGDEGGAIYAEALDFASGVTLAIDNTSFMSNTADTNGGALYLGNTNRGEPGVTYVDAIISNSLFANNRAVENGGAIRVSSSANITNGSALAELEMVNVTLSGNRAGEEGSALNVDSFGLTTTTNLVTATNLSLVGNARVGGSDIHLNAGTFVQANFFLKNSLVAQSRGTSCVNNNNSFAISGANNLLRQNSCANSAPFRLGNPLGVISELSDNGGDSFTHGLYSGSNAIDAVPAGQCTVGTSAIALTTDQRGEPRPSGPACDIGAFEATAPPTADPITGLTASNDSPTDLTLPTTFVASVTGGDVDFYAWDFGDGNSGSGITTTHTYTQSGSFTATVTATNAEGDVSATTSVVINSNVPPLVGLTASNDGPTAVGNPTTFSAALTAGVAESYSWDFGDQGSDTGSSPIHTYATAGVYTATVVASNANNTLTATTTVYVGDAVVEVFNNFYDPTPVTVPVGSKVVWVLREGSHSVTAADDSFEQPAGSSWPPFINTFSAPGSFDYFCSVHGQNMSGQVIVDGDLPPDGLRLPNIRKVDETATK